MLVRQYQTGCTRTGGQGISEKPHDAFRGSPLLVLGADERLKGCEVGNWGLSGRVFHVRILFSKRITGNWGAGCIFDGDGGVGEWRLGVGSVMGGKWL